MDRLAHPPLAGSKPLAPFKLELSLEHISNCRLEQGITNGSVKAGGNYVEEERRRRTFFGKDMTYWVLMVASGVALVLGLSSASILGRYYYVHGGSRRWVYTWIQSAGWPVLIIPLILGYWRRGPTTCRLHMMRPTHAITPKLCLIYTSLGALVTFDNLLYSLGCSYLPVSTNALLCSSQLAFNALFTYFLVGQKMSPYILNSIIIISLGTVLLGVGAGSDKPPGTSERDYIVGVIVTIAASGLYALILPLLQLVYISKDVQGAPCMETGVASPSMMSSPNTLATLILESNAPTNGGIMNSTDIKPSTTPSFLLVLEVQIAVSVFASLFAFIGMCINADLAAMHAEALHFDGGSLAYIMILVWSALGWQLYFLGVSGIIFLSSSLMSCVFSTAMIAIMPILAIIFFHDSFSATKGIAMILSIWGFMSYIYDGYIAHRSKKDSANLDSEEA